ncbi:Bifunctional cytochrome P450/NADPH--P450 reductase [Nymphon striatum]|nr:Bifunctional cytochrome P450/NADPH--P450 reductase [Nymphon striatum]
MTGTPPKPESRPDKVSLWAYAKLFRQDILSAQPLRLYRAWMAEFRTPFFRSYMVNQPELVQIILKERPQDFPKSNRIGEGLKPLLGDSVFLTNGEVWKRQRRIIDPAFEDTRVAAAHIRGLITELTMRRQAEIKAGTAPDDLATKIMTTPDPETGELFSAEEMVDQVAIFFLAGHETSASALAWALYLLATHPDWQTRVADEAQDLTVAEFGSGFALANQP